ncbi:MAG TPA: hypothetical protein VG125_32310 [Pirellulales bacterium]|nr:hypothetical protein [Pirellulales bacterium]
MFRFSLRWLLVFVAMVAVGLVSLLYATKPLSDCLSVAWFGLLLVAIFGVVYRSQRQRAFWLGCCVFGWSFAAYAHLVKGETIAYRAIESLYGAVKWSVPADEKAMYFHGRSGGTFENLGVGARRIFFPRLYPFLSASHSLLGIVIAVIGGLIAQWFHATRDRNQRA